MIELPRWWIGTLVAAGLLLIGSAVWHVSVLGPPTTPVLHRSIDLVLIAGVGLGFIYGGYWHSTRSIPPEQYLRIVAWSGGSTILFVSLTIIGLYVGSEQVSNREFIHALHPTGSVGLLAGLLVGTIHAQAIGNAEAAARVEAKAEAIQAEQERMAHLHDLLRHYILNGVTVITGHAERLRPMVPEEERVALDAIAERADSMATLVEHFRDIPSRDRLASNPRPVNSVVDSATASLQSNDRFVVTLPTTEAHVQSNAAVEKAVTLLCEAIVSLTDMDGRLDITAEQAGQVVTLSLNAEPAELPQRLRESLFEPIMSGVGLKFYLAKTLLDDYGELTLCESTTDGLAFEIRLDVPNGGVEADR